MSLENTHLGAAAIRELLKDKHHIFFIGIGGVNMSSLAWLSQIRGFTVSGSDRAKNDLTRSLEEQGIQVYYSHDRRHIKDTDVDVVVYTNAIGADNEEYRAAVRKGLPCLSRADYMGYLMSGYSKRVGVSGMHGKSTCTAMLSEIFLQEDCDPTILCGAKVKRMDSFWRIGRSKKLFLFEACEYMDSFLDFCPNVAVILNIEEDHMDYFSSLEQIRTSFRAYADKVGSAGYVLANADDANVRLALSDCRRNVVTFGLNVKSADFTATNVSMTRGKPHFDVMRNGTLLCHIDLTIPGRHNIYNALAAVAAATLCGADPQTAGQRLNTFTGAVRRMEYKGKLRGADVYDDYGHHPTEIAATLEGVAKMGYDRVFCVFQPHTYSRLAALYDDFVQAFRDADLVVIAETYAAREVNTFDVSAKGLAADIGPRAEYFDSFDSIAKYLWDNVYDDDVIIVMGAGDIYKLFGLMGL